LMSWLNSVKTKLKNAYFKEKVEELELFISSGDSLSKAMRKMPDIFPVREISLLEAWESTGNLVSALWNLAEELRKTHDLTNKVKSSLTYPLIIVLFLLLAIVVVMVFVIPELSWIFSDAGKELPLATRALVATSDFFIHKYPIIIIVLSLLWLTFYYNINTDSGRRKFDSMILSMPLIWPVLKNYTLAIVASTLWNLVAWWVPILKALLLVGKSTNNLVYEWLFNEIIEKVKSWKKIVESMMEVDTEWKYFLADFVQMLSVWEKTASIDKIATKINIQYTREVDNSLGNLTKWIEPLAILAAWIFVLWFAIAIFGAILQVTDTVG